MNEPEMSKLSAVFVGSVVIATVVIALPIFYVLALVESKFPGKLTPTD
jgi:cytochrome c oxidase assembly factor CtaG